MPGEAWRRAEASVQPAGPARDRLGRPGERALGFSHRGTGFWLIPAAAVQGESVNTNAEAPFAAGPADAAGGLDPAGRSGYTDHPPRMGFFTDTSVCIGCKACEVACKEWNAVPEDGLELTGMSYDNTGSLGASTWRHVAFIEQIGRPGAVPARGEAPGKT